jgi:hypothetical protein
MRALRVGLIYSVSSNKNIFPNLEVYDLICILGTADVCSLIIWALCVYTCYVLLIVFWCIKAAQTATFVSHVIITLLT